MKVVAVPELQESNSLAYTENVTTHDDQFDYTAPEVAAARGLAYANANGSSQARRRARIIIFIAFGLPILLAFAVLIVEAF